MGGGGEKPKRKKRTNNKTEKREPASYCLLACVKESNRWGQSPAVAALLSAPLWQEQKPRYGSPVPDYLYTYPRWPKQRGQTPPIDLTRANETAPPSMPSSPSASPTSRYRFPRSYQRQQPRLERRRRDFRPPCSFAQPNDATHPYQF